VVSRASLVEVLGQRPRSRVGIVRLNGCTAPGGVAVAVNEEFAVAPHNRNHDSVVDEAAQYRTIDLSKEHDTGRDLDCICQSASGIWALWDMTRTIFTHLQVITQVDCVVDDIVRPSSKVHITNGASREHKTRQHL
jgi:hypothetical protein